MVLMPPSGSGQASYQASDASRPAAPSSLVGQHVSAEVKKAVRAARAVEAIDEPQKPPLPIADSKPPADLVEEDDVSVEPAAGVSAEEPAPADLDAAASVSLVSWKSTR